MKNSVMDALLALEQQKVNFLEEVAEHYASRTYLYEQQGELQRPGFKLHKHFFDLMAGRFRIKFLFDEPLKSEMCRLFDADGEEISDIARSYRHFKSHSESSSFDLLDHFSSTEYDIRTVEEIVCTAGFLVDQYVTNGSPVVNCLLQDNQENLDLGIVILKKPMIRGIYEPEVAYNVHLEFKVGLTWNVDEIHLHIFEFPRFFKTNRHCLI